MFGHVATYRQVPPHWHLGQEKLAVLRDEWESCEGNWKNSSLYKTFILRKSSRTHGARLWLTKPQIAAKYGGDMSIAEKICANKMADVKAKEKQTKWHPDAPGDEDHSTQTACTHAHTLHIYQNPWLP